MGAGEWHGAASHAVACAFSTDPIKIWCLASAASGPISARDEVGGACSAERHRHRKYPVSV